MSPSIEEAPVAEEAITTDELTVTFRNPVVLGSEAYQTMTLREPTAAQIMECGGLEGWAFDVRLLALVSGIPEPALKQLGARDTLKGTRFLGSFLA